MPDILKIIGEWDDDLSWCPSQCYLNVEYDGKCYTLYLRWRWDNPWRGYIVQGPNVKDPEAEQSPDLFTKYHEQYSDTELGLTKLAVIRLAEKWLSEHQ